MVGTSPRSWRHASSRAMTFLLRFLIACFGLLLWTGSTTAQWELSGELIHVRPVVKNLEIPWDLVLEPGSNDVWFTEKKGTINRLDVDEKKVETLYTIPRVFQSPKENSGLHSMAFHPQWPDSSYLYLHYTFSADNSRLVRLHWDQNANAPTRSEHLLDSITAARSHNGSRLAFDEEGLLYFCVGDAYLFDPAQDIQSLNGKVLRMTSHGSIPTDNPFPNSYTYSFGHRNPQGMTFTPDGRLYLSEHGASSDDELNLIEKAGNYGWPKVHGYCDEDFEESYCKNNDLKKPLNVWTPTNAPSGLSFYAHTAIPSWSNCLLQTFLKGNKLTVISLSKDGTRVLSEADYFIAEYLRLRDVQPLPDGRLLLATSNLEVAKPPTRDHDDKVLMVSAAPSGRKAPAEVRVQNGKIVVKVNVKEEVKIQLAHEFPLMLEEQTLMGRGTVTFETKPEREGPYMIKLYYDGGTYYQRLLFSQ